MYAQIEKRGSSMALAPSLPFTPLSDVTAKLARLKELAATIGSSQQIDRTPWPCSQLEGGLPRGSLIEISGHGRTEALVRILAEHPELPSLWIEANFQLFPPALAQRKLVLERTYFVDAGREAAWAATTVLRSQICPFLIYHAPYGAERFLRRLQLLAERSGTIVFLLPEGKPRQAWPIHLSLEAKGRKLHTLRRK
jgi:hypothetical protein